MRWAGGWEEVLARIRGAGPKASAEVFRAAFGDGFDYPSAKEMRNKWVEEHIERHGVPIKPGLKDLLAKLIDAGIRRPFGGPKRRNEGALHL